MPTTSDATSSRPSGGPIPRSATKQPIADHADRRARPARRRRPASAAPACPRGSRPCPSRTRHRAPRGSPSPAGSWQGARRPCGDRPGAAARDRYDHAPCPIPSAGSTTCRSRWTTASCCRRRCSCPTRPASCRRSSTPCRTARTTTSWPATGTCTATSPRAGSRACASTCAAPGSSTGILENEYLAREQDDLVRAIALIARAAVVHRAGRHDRRLVGRLQRRPGRDAPAAGAARDRADPLHGRPLPLGRPLRRPARCR